MLGLVSVVASTRAAITFTTLDFPGSHFTIAAGVSGGTVVGSYEGSNGAEHGFIYNGSTFTTLDAPGATWTECDGISGGTVVGTYYGSSGANHGFIYDGHTIKTLDVPGAFETFVTGISGNTVAGCYLEGDFSAHGFIYNGSTFTTLDVPGAHLGSSQGTFIFGISGGTIVGYYTSNTIIPDSTHYKDNGFIYDGSTFTTLDFSESDDTKALAVSSGIVAGTLGDQGFTYDGSTFTLFDFPLTYATPYGISGNTIVGYYTDNYTTVHGFVAQLSEPLPRISLTTSNRAVIAWPYPSTGWNLQQNSDLSGANWVTPPETVGNDGTNSFILVNTSSGNRFFRLKHN